jgi:TusA-related sulfurtransferase
MKRRPDVSLDVSDLLAPITFLKVQATLSAMKEGQLLEILCTDEETRLDLSDIVKNSGHQFVSSNEKGNRFRFLIKKIVSNR